MNYAREQEYNGEDRRPPFDDNRDEAGEMDGMVKDDVGGRMITGEVEVVPHEDEENTLKRRNILQHCSVF